jgi:hypothetical protein
MKCPRCHTAITANKLYDRLRSTDVNKQEWTVQYYTCPECGRIVIELVRSAILRTENSETRVEAPITTMAYPKGIAREPLSKEVPTEFAEDHREACLVLPDSPKASAALSRRCLHHILREKAGATERDLAKQIQTVIDTNQLLSYLADDLDAVRNIGNFAAHPNKSINTEEIVGVESKEAEWKLEVIESLFDFYFVAPARAKVRRDALNQKLKDANKPPMKSSTP